MHYWKNKLSYILVYKNKKIIGCYNLEKTNEVYNLDKLN